MAETRRFAGFNTRSELKAANNLGIVLTGDRQKSTFRRPDLDKYDAYYEGRQYNNLSPWDQSHDASNDYIPVRQRKPRLQYALANMLASRIAAKLVGSRTFPQFKIEEDPDTEAYLNAIKQSSRVKTFILEPVRRMLVAGSAFVRFRIINGQWRIENYLAKWCFPEFDPAGNLEFIKIQYVFNDYEDLDEKGKPKKKWYRVDLGKESDVLYDNPPATDGEPEFKVVDSVDHNLGFVQGEWLKTSEVQNSIDGESLIEPILDFIDELNYSLSQSSSAIQYNQDPQLALKNMDEEEVETLIRSSTKAWNLGKDGEASFVEAGMSGVEAADSLREKIRLNIQDITRVVMMDPEKMVAQAQSGRALEVLHGPLVELVEELRGMLEKSLLSLMLKMAFANAILEDSGALVPVPLPDGYAPTSFNATIQWPDIFPPTMEDLRTKVSIATSVASANILSRETAMKWLAKEFGVENIEEELAKIASQPVINPFGGF